MFTGLIETLGKVEKSLANNAGKEIHIYCPQLAGQVKVDDSVAINGACQTVILKNETSFTVQAVHVTLEKTTFGDLKSGDLVNLELALKAQDRLGGHFVQGHVNGIGPITKIVQRGGNYEVWLKIPQTLLKYVIQEGSIALDGISLTVAQIKNDQVMVSIIPHTWEKTNLSLKKIGHKMNIEVDMMAKYLENFLAPYLKQNTGTKINSLESLGF